VGLKRQWDEEPFWTALIVLLILAMTSCVAHNICVEWRVCKGKMDGPKVEVGG